MIRHDELNTVDNWEAEAEFLSSTIKRLPGPLQILEAGCGRAWPLNLDGVDYRLTGIDLDANALKSRVESVGDLPLCQPGLRHLPPDI